MNDPAVVASEWESRLYRAMIDCDEEQLEVLLADDLVYIHSTGVAETKSEYLAGVLRGLYDYGAVGAHSVRTLDDDGYVIRNGIVEMTVGERGAPRGLVELLHTFVWRVGVERWQLVLRQGTRIPHTDTASA